MPECDLDGDQKLVFLINKYLFINYLKKSVLLKHAQKMDFNKEGNKCYCYFGNLISYVIGAK